MAVGITFGVLPNIAIITGIYRNKTLQKPTFYLMANLAACDLMMGVSLLCNFLLSLTANLKVLSPSVHGILCKIFATFPLYWSFTASIQTLIIISTERYNAILRPTKKLTPKRVKSLCLLAWTISFIISLPFLITSTSINNSCVAFKSHSAWVMIINIILIVFQFIIPAVAMFTVYTLILCQLKKKDLAGRNQSNKNKKLKRKTVYMLFTTTILFIVFATPWTISLLIIALSGKFSFQLIQDDRNPVVQSIVESGKMLLPLATVYNPIVYCIFNQNIRQLFFPCYYKRSCRIRPIQALSSSRTKSERCSNKLHN